MSDVDAAVRTGPGRRAVAVVVAVDLAIATAVGFGVYFAKRQFGPPTPPEDVGASAALCDPTECSEVTPQVTLRWTPPVAGSEVVGYVVLRDGEEVARVSPGAREFVDEDVTVGDRYGYDVLAIGEEGRGVPAPTVSVRAPVPPIEHARLSGWYDVVLVFRQIGFLSRFEGVDEPAVGDRALQDWQITSDCDTFAGACDVRLLGGTLRRDGRRYGGAVPSSALCGDDVVRSTQTVRLLVTESRVVGGLLYATAFRGRSDVDFRCGGGQVHAVATFTGTLE